MTENSSEESHVSPAATAPKASRKAAAQPQRQKRTERHIARQNRRTPEYEQYLRNRQKVLDSDAYKSNLRAASYSRAVRENTAQIRQQTENERWKDTVEQPPSKGATPPRITVVNGGLPGQGKRK